MRIRPVSCLSESRQFCQSMTMGDKRETIAQALRGVPWLAGAEPAILHDLVAGARMQSVQHKQSLARGGQAIDHLMVVADGQIELSLSSAIGRRRVVGILGPGQVFGLIPVLDGSAVIHDAQANGPGALVLLPRESLLKAMQHSHALTMSLVLLLCQRSRLIYESLTDHSLLPLKGRIARSLLGLSNAYGLVADDHRGSRRVRMSQADLGDLLGVSRQSLNLELKKMERAGLVRITYNHIELCDPAGLHLLLVDPNG